MMDSTSTGSLSKEKRQANYQMYASLAFMMVVVIIGIPMWWKTTEVYRMSLPSTNIIELKPTSIKISTVISIYCQDSMRSSIIINELKNYFHNNDYWDIKFIQIAEIDNIADTNISNYFEVLSNKFSTKPGHFTFIESLEIEEDILLTSDRLAFITASTTSMKIYQLLKENIFHVSEIEALIDGDKGVHKLPLQPQNDVLITVLNPRPDMYHINWDVRTAMDMYISPFLQQLNQTSNYVLKTQWRYDISSDFDITKVNDSTEIGRHFVLSENNIPHMIRSFEKKLGSGIGDNPSFNFILYIPPCDMAPLYIRTNAGKQMNKNIESFVSLKWGGVVIYNPPVASCLQCLKDNEQLELKINSKDVTDVFLFHLKQILGFHSEITISGIKTINVNKVIVNKWEYDSYIRRNTINHITTATRTLHSLINLLDNINYIVITDEVGKAVNSSFESIIMAKSYLEKDSLLEASYFAKTAYIQSEQAFFDATLLAQLYFPDEQKYAIYIPLFLPIMIPVLSSASILKHFFVKEKKILN